MTPFERMLLGDVVLPGTWPGMVFYGLIFLVIAWLSARVVRASVTHLVRRHEEDWVDLTAVTFLGQLAQVGIYLAAAVLYAHIVPPLRAVGTALLAGVSIASIVIGLAAQSTLGNLVAGFSVVLYRPFRIGDVLRVGAPGGVESGVVERLTLGYTVLRGEHGQRVVVPNSVMASQITVNLGHASHVAGWHDHHVDASETLRRREGAESVS
jgi:small conductance mechanosensitive channel